MKSRGRPRFHLLFRLSTLNFAPFSVASFLSLYYIDSFSNPPTFFLVFAAFIPWDPIFFHLSYDSGLVDFQSIGYLSCGRIFMDSLF